MPAHTAISVNEFLVDKSSCTWTASGFTCATYFQKWESCRKQPFCINEGDENEDKSSDTVKADG